MSKPLIHDHHTFIQVDALSQGPTLDPITFTLADSMRRKISGGNRWDSTLEGYLQRWMGLMPPPPLVRRAASEARKQQHWMLLEEARRKKENRGKTLDSASPVTPPVTPADVAEQAQTSVGGSAVAGSPPVPPPSMDVDDLLLDSGSG